MKKISILVSGLLTAASVFASNPGTSAVMEFYTTGPDTYEDGTPVLEGETYLFVYVPGGATFGGVNTAGSLVSAQDKIVGQAPAWLDDSTGFIRCPFRAISYSTTDYPAGGSFCIVLLDTRKNATTVGGQVDNYSTGASTQNSALGGPGATVASKDGNSFTVASNTGSAVSLLNAETDTPVIKDIKTGADGKAVVTIDNMRAYGSYKIQESSSLTGWQDAAVDKVQGVAGDTAITVPAAPSNVRFFKVFAK